MDSASARSTWLLVVIFAVAMAWVEAACVYDLRVMVNRLDPYQPNPLPLAGKVGAIELVREAATLVMLAAVGALSGRTLRARCGYAAVAFGVWDIFYYVWLKIMYGWPTSPFDWDILFLLPLPWWGPVAAPVSIAALMIGWGTLASRPGSTPGRDGVASPVWAAAALGASLALYAFMADALRAIPHGAEAVRTVLPTTFNWPVFGMGLALMTVPVASMVRPFSRVAAPRSARLSSPGALPSRRSVAALARDTSSSRRTPPRARRGC